MKKNEYSNIVKKFFEISYIGKEYRIIRKHTHSLISKNSIILLELASKTKKETDPLHCIVKIYSEERSDAQFLNEYNFLRLYGDQPDIYLPKVYDACLIDNLYVLLMEYIEGIPLLHCVENENFCCNFLKTIMEIECLDISQWMFFKKYKSLECNKINTFKLNILNKKIKTDANLFIPMFEKLISTNKHLSWYKSSIIHNDLNLNNVIVKDNGQHVVIDWTSVSIFDSRYDFADIHLKMKFLLGDTGTVNKFYTMYCDKKKLSKEEYKYFYFLNILEKTVDNYILYNKYNVKSRNKDISSNWIQFILNELVYVSNVSVSVSVNDFME